jgi:diphosphomevalonate decarboxylase
MTTAPLLSAGAIQALQEDHQGLLLALAAAGLTYEPYPTSLGDGQREGAAAARAYPIQGILKYHGMADWDLRTAYLPSISVNNDAAYTLTLVRYDAGLPADEVVINGETATGRPRERVVSMLDTVRALARIETRAQVISRNVVRAQRVGKGLGTSASASAALAMAAIGATLGAEAACNRRLLSCMARLLAGSGCRSATGGLSLWLSYPGISHEDSFAVRLDRHSELADLCLLTVPLDSSIGLATEAAHHDAPRSPFFEPWALGRRDEIVECIQATLQGDWRTLGQLAELDSIRLHGVTMSGSRENKLFAWEPENIALFRLCNDLRASQVPIYFSTDTGPTTVFLTHRQHEGAVAQAIADLDLGLEVVRGDVAGPAELVALDQAEQELGLP